MACYEAEFEPLPVDPEEGVPLEHLVSCVKGVLIQQGVTGIKSIIAVGGGGGEDDVSGGQLELEVASFTTVSLSTRLGQL